MKEEKDSDSQEVKIIGPKILNNNNMDLPTNDAYPTFKNRLKALFNEFANEEGQNLNHPSMPAIDFSEKI